MITMFDTVDTPLLPPGGFAYAGYVDGRFANTAQIRARFPHASVLSIAVFARDNADCLDIETGDASPAQAAGWVSRQLARGLKRPCLYASASVMREVLSDMKAAGVPRSLLRLWSAHYTDQAHICGPDTCREMDISADGTQFTDRSRGINLDESLLLPDFFSDIPGGAFLSPAEMEAIMNDLPVLSKGMADKDLPHWYVRRLQAILNYVYGYPCNLTGVYDPMTVNAVRLLQGRHKLAIDGICGPDTWSKVVGG